MLTREENELLCRTGAGTPMGRLMRRYWIPALLSSELPKRDGAPLRLRLLGEDLVAFRATDGTPGLVDARCPHRGADLFFGRNEENGLRCVYHGWKFDASGKCVDMPSEPPESNFKNKVSVTAYPCEEHGGVIWAYMGPPGLKPAFPETEWTSVPESHRYVTRRLQECNWLQGYEGGWDTAHLPFLHRGDTRGSTYFSGKGAQMMAGLPSKYEFIATDYGFVYGRGRQNESGGMSWECALMFMPSWKLFRPIAGPDARTSLLAWVPQDDESCIVWAVEYHPEKPVAETGMEWSLGYNYTHVETLPGSIRPLRNRDNDYLVDRDLQASGNSWTGIKGLGLQDSAIQESMGPVADRTRENLGTADIVLVKLRRHLLKTLEDLDAGKPLFGMEPSSYQVTSRILQLDRKAPLTDHLEGLRLDKPVFAK
jgi:phthalate 4,5-dioxygenase oxygenase subunit